MLDSYRTLLLKYREYLDSDVFALPFPSTSIGKPKQQFHLALQQHAGNQMVIKFT